MLHLREWGIACLAAGLVLAGCDDRPRKYSDPTKDLYKPLYGYFRITAEVTAEGRRMTIENIYECRRVPASIDRAAHYVVSDNRLVKRLPSGAGIMIPLNSAIQCGGGYWATRPGEMPNLPGFRPLKYGAIPTIYWFDDVENPTVIEGYISPAYYERSDARVRFHGLKVEPLSRGSETRQPYTDPSKEFPWLGRSREERAEWGWITYSMRVAPRKLWVHEAELVERLKGLTEITDISTIINEIGGLSVETNTALAIGGRFGGFLPYIPPPSAGYSQQRMAQYHEAVARSAYRRSAFPTLDGDWRTSLSADWPGDFVIFRPYHELAEFRDWKINIDGYFIRIVTGSRSNIFYDPNTDQLFRVAWHHF